MDSTAVAQGLTSNYISNGRKADGALYTGTAVLSQNGPQVWVKWIVGNGSYAGVETLDGRVLTVKWGTAAPVVYVLMSNGTLHGT